MANFDRQPHREVSIPTLHQTLLTTIDQYKNQHRPNSTVPLTSRIKDPESGGLTVLTMDRYNTRHDAFSVFTDGRLIKTDDGVLVVYDLPDSNDLHPVLVTGQGEVYSLEYSGWRGIPTHLEARRLEPEEVQQVVKQVINPAIQKGFD